MIKIDFENNTYECPFCGKAQAFSERNRNIVYTGYAQNYDVILYHIKCSNKKCEQMSVVAKHMSAQKQWDLIPDNVCKNYPEYIPSQIRSDYMEASAILEKSPKAAATLLRRCLQGMIHDFWGIHEKNLNAEITKLKDKLSPTQWKAIDGLRSMGNIGAHMESDVNLIIDIDAQEAQKLQKLIELLIEKWYIARHDEELLFDEIAQTAEEKQDKRNAE